MKRIFLLILIANYGFAQPAIEWIRTYHVGNHEYGKDVYAVSNGDLIFCGESKVNLTAFDREGNICVVRTTDRGEVIWSQTYDLAGTCEIGRSIIETDDGNFLIGGLIGVLDDCQMAAMLINSEGELIWSNTYGGKWCDAVIELKSGEYLLAGEICPEINNDNGYVVCINNEGEVLWNREYDYAWHDRIVSMRETDGGVVIVGESDLEISQRSWVMKIDPANGGETIWSRFPVLGERSGFNCIASHQDGGFVICGADGLTSRSFIVKVDDLGFLEWTQWFNFNVNDRLENLKSIARIGIDDGYCSVGYFHLDGERYSTAIQIDTEGNEIWRGLYSGDDLPGANPQMQTVVALEDGTLVGQGDITGNDTGRDVLMMKLQQWVEHPSIIEFSPADTVFTVLQEDSVEFSVSARDQQGDAIYYQWNYDDEEVSRDSLVTIHFRELGLHEVQCVVTDSANFVEIRWHITVDDFFIVSTTPDSLRLLTRRGSTLPFTMDVACVEPDEPTVEWTVVNRDNDSEFIGEADTVEVCFDLAGDWAVEAEASWNGERESVRWAVDVRSAVWWWMPHEDAISVNRNEQRDFSVFPFDPDSDSLSIGWWLDGDSLDSNAEVLTLDFPDHGEYALVSIVRDGVEADTITWAITDTESGVEPDRNGLPFELALHPPAPNPFNSTTTIGYSLPVAGNVSLAVYDLSGREVTRLVDGTQLAGNHEVVWTADGVASGVYVVAMDAGSMMLREKVVLVK